MTKLSSILKLIIKILKKTEQLQIINVCVYLGLFNPRVLLRICGFNWLDELSMLVVERSCLIHASLMCS